jgi:tight adherence protein B
MIFLFISLILFFIFSVLGLLWALYKIWDQNFKNKNTKMRSRIQFGHSVDKDVKQINTTYSPSSKLAEFLEKTSLTSHMGQKLLHSGIKLSFIQLIILSIGLFVVIFILSLYLNMSFLAAIIFGLMIASIPYAWVSYKYGRRQILLERQLPDILDFIARSMQAGHDFNSALKLAAQESPLPISEEFQLVFDEVNFGGTVHHAMEGLSQRIDCPDVRYFAIAVLINREIGGDISSLLKNVAALIRDRLTFKDTVYAMTAEGRVSALILGAMPFLIGLLIFYVSPGFIDVMWTDETGQKMFFYAFLLMMFGGFWMYRMVQIKV